MKHNTFFKRISLSLLAFTLLLVAHGALAAPVYPGDVTTGPPEVLFDISIQPVFGNGNSVWFLIALVVVVVAVLAVAYMFYQKRKKKILQKISQINETK